MIDVLVQLAKVSEDIAERCNHSLRRALQLLGAEDVAGRSQIWTALLSTRHGCHVAVRDAIHLAKGTIASAKKGRTEIVEKETYFEFFAEFLRQQEFLDSSRDNARLLDIQSVQQLVVVAVPLTVRTKVTAATRIFLIRCIRSLAVIGQADEQLQRSFLATLICDRDVRVRTLAAIMAPEILASRHRFDLQAAPPTNSYLSSRSCNWTDLIAVGSVVKHILLSVVGTERFEEKR